jgi:hypothetical protein
MPHARKMLCVMQPTTTLCNRWLKDWLKVWLKDWLKI